MGEGGQHHAPAALPPGKTRYPFYRRLGGPRAGLDRCTKSRPPPGFDPLTVQSVASRSKKNYQIVTQNYAFIQERTNSTQ
jgi:hypothetical protein